MDIPSWVYRGAPVVCTDAVFDGMSATPLRQGGEYIISSVSVERSHRGVGRYAGPGVVVWLAECGNPFTFDGCFALDRFRPLVSQQDDIEAHFSRFLETGRDARITEGV